MRHRIARGLIRIAALAAAVGLAGSVVAMTVQPIVINLTTAGRGMTQVVTVENTFAQPLPVEIRVEELSLEADGVKGTGKDSGDLLVFPVQAMIKPGQTQTFRLQYVGDPDLAKSKHYYATVAQLPVQLPQGQSAIQILYNFQVLVSVAPQGAKSDLKVAGAALGHDKAGKPVPVVTLSNASNAHGYLSQGRLRIVQRDGAGKEIFRRTLSGPEIQQTIGFGLVGAGQTRKVQVPIALPQDGGSVEAQFTPGG
ncbi:MAG TPA: fimbria/pilus periplasmic chaperone [Allosphingosinicella sp.]|nr:fimbria/pilus periplasmic chaperone [Allosphingosinicella sp.]